MTNDPLPELPAGAFSKQDPGDDLAFLAIAIIHIPDNGHSHS